MKRNLIYNASASLVACCILTSCFTTNSSDYLGTMVGSDIGGMLGSSLGMASTRGSFGGGLFGGIVGSAAGAAVGNKISKNSRINRQQKRQEKLRAQSEQANDENISSSNGLNDEIGDFQSEGGAVYESDKSNFTIGNISLTDTDGDGMMSKDEILKLVCDVTNLSSTDTDVVITTGDQGNSRLSFSPGIQATIEGGKSIRYTSKIRCDKLPSSPTIDVPVMVSSPTLGSFTRHVTIRVNK
mgnify:CR=1 FL=1